MYKFSLKELASPMLFPIKMLAAACKKYAPEVICLSRVPAAFMLLRVGDCGLAS